MNDEHAMQIDYYLLNYYLCTWKCSQYTYIEQQWLVILKNLLFCVCLLAVVKITIETKSTTDGQGTYTYKKKE